MRTDLPKQFLRAAKTTIALLLNPHYLLCYGIAWLITNGWAYVFTAAGSMFDIGWMVGLGSGYLALIWLPFTPEKLITLAIAILLKSGDTGVVDEGIKAAYKYIIQTVKKGQCNSLSADCKSKIGDMRGDFRAFPSGKASLHEQTAGSVAQ